MPKRIFINALREGLGLNKPMMPELNITLSRTADGSGTYVQIMSEDMLSVNVVLVAKEVVLDDIRGLTGKKRTSVAKKRKLRNKK